MKKKSTPARVPTATVEPLPAVRQRYQRTAHDNAQYAAWQERDKAQRVKLSRVKVSLDEKSKIKIEMDHPDDQVALAALMNAFATADVAYLAGTLDRLADLTRAGDTVDGKEADFMLALVRGIEPRDQLESMLATQMAAVHSATLAAAYRLKQATLIEQHEAALTAVNKLARTFSTQIETLKRYRATGEQSIRVQHVTVHDGGQAIVAGKLTGGGVGAKNGNQSLEPNGTPEQSPALLGQVEALALALPCAGGSRQDRLPLPRCQRRSPKG